MERDLALLRKAAQRVTADLRFALGDGWTCRVDDSLVLTLTGPKQSESALLDPEVEEFFEPTGSSPEAPRPDLDVDADDVVTRESLEILRVLGVSGPTCPDHGDPFLSCSSVWVCPSGHDGPFIGDLATGGSRPAGTSSS